MFNYNIEQVDDRQYYKRIDHQIKQTINNGITILPGGKLSGKAKEKEQTHETRVISMENKQQMMDIL